MLGTVSINHSDTERGVPKTTLKDAPMNAASAMGLALRMLSQWLRSQCG